MLTVMRTRGDNQTDAYLERQIAKDDSHQKQLCRNWVADHLLDRHDPNRPMRLFSLPSINWTFERQMEERRAEIEFVGVERNAKAWRESMKIMPGQRRTQFSEEAEHGKMPYWESEKAKMGLIELSAFMGFFGNRAAWGRSKKQHDTMKKRWARWTAVWLDFTSQLCRETEATLPRISSFCCSKTARIPIAVTILAARDVPDINNKRFLLDLDRVEYVKTLLGFQRFRRFEFVDHFQYNSGAGVPMTTILGELVSDEHKHLSDQQ